MVLVCRCEEMCVLGTNTLPDHVNQFCVSTRQFLIQSPPSPREQNTSPTPPPDPQNAACITDAERKSLYALFLESVQSRLRRGEESPADTVAEQQATRQSLIRMQSLMARHLELDDVHDPLLAINFARWAPPPSGCRRLRDCAAGCLGAGPGSPLCAWLAFSSCSVMAACQ